MSVTPTALPGGAPIRKKASKKPCKYGERDAEGFCPKKPKGPARAKKSKAPCKYGPRDADGFCPKKPKKPVEAKPKGKLDVEIFAGVTPSGKVKTTTPKKILYSTITKASDELTRKGVDEGLKWINSEKGKAALASGAPKALKFLGTLGIAGAIASAVIGLSLVAGRAVSARDDKAADDFARKELASTMFRLPKKAREAVTQQMQETWLDQYRRFWLGKIQTQRALTRGGY